MNPYKETSLAGGQRDEVLNKLMLVLSEETSLIGPRRMQIKQEAPGAQNGAH